MPKKVVALFGASHPGPSAVVTAVAALLGVALGYSPGRVVLLAATVLAGQLSIGWSNDWIDADRDAAVHRSDKPTVTGTIPVAAVRAAAFTAVASTLLLSIFLGPWAVLVNLICVAGGWAYNLGLKATPLSVVPYIVTFGLLPALATVSGPVPQPPTAWVVGVGALLGVAAHFTNVLPDLRDDSETGIRGLPHRVGATASGVVAFSALAASALLLALGPGWPPRPVLIVGLILGVGIAALGIALTTRGTTTRLLMRLIMAGALIDVVMLVLAGPSLTA